MQKTLLSLYVGLGALALVACSVDVNAKPQNLQPIVNAGEKTLSFDWPAISVGTGEYAEGPTGVTVIRFNKRSAIAVDVRGGGPGTVNAAYMEMGKDEQELDAVVFSGGSWYGLEAVTAVATALKDDGIRDGDAFGAVPNIAMSVGSIIFDFGSRRLNEVYPDKKLAQAAYRAAKTGSFPQGSQGAGRFTKSGGFFGCNAHSGQGAAFRQIGDVKIMAIVVANPYGAIVDRDGKLTACYKGKGWPKNVDIQGLMQGFPNSRNADWKGKIEHTGGPKNTTVSLIVTNQKLSAEHLKRWAVQVHTSMGRGIQPFQTMFDGDVLYAVSTNEIEFKYWVPDLGVMTSEVMWDALLNSVPKQPQSAVPSEKPVLSRDDLKALSGEYVFSEFVKVQISSRGNKLYAKANGKRGAYNIKHGKKVELIPVSKTDFMVPGRYPHTIRFSTNGKMIMNPGHWKQIGHRK